MDSHIEYLLSKNKETIVNDEILNFVKEQPMEEDDILYYGIPTSISIDAVDINLEIKEGAYDYSNQTWTLTNHYAYWANLSNPILARNSTTVIYAHNQNNEFYNTKYLKIGDIIDIKTNENVSLKFKYVGDDIVSPNRGDILFEESTTSQIILITCNGIFSESRRVIYALLVPEEEENSFAISNYHLRYLDSKENDLSNTNSTIVDTILNTSN